MVIPTGIGCEVGGHAGDATPTARALSVVCDKLFIHPNVVNASDINEMTDNMVYVEGSTLDRFLQGQIALEEVYSNKVLLIVNPPLQNETINSVNAVRNTIGMDVEILELEKPIKLKGHIRADGSAGGTMTGAEEAVVQIKKTHKNFDAIAIQTGVDVDEGVVLEYIRNGSGVNPYGAVEAICSRYFSKAFNLQSAHAPFESGTLATFNEVVDERLSAEIVSISYLHCIMKGLHKAPRIAEYDSKSRAVFRVDDIDLMVSPDGCWGVPHIACSEWGIPIIFVKENKNIKEPFKTAPDNCYLVDNYLEAIGMICAMKAGVINSAVRRNVNK